LSSNGKFYKIIINIDVVFSAFICKNSILKFMMLQMNASVPTTTTTTNLFALDITKR